MAVKLGTAYVDVQGDFTSLNKQISAAISPLTSKFGGLGKAATVGLAGVGAAAVGAGAALYGIGEQFDDAYDTIRVATGKTGKQLDGLKGDFKNVVKSVPTDFKSASTAIGTLNSRLGLTGKPLQGLSKQFLELSRITGTDLSGNIESVTRVFGDWNIKTKAQPKALDLLFRASQKTGVPVQKLGDMIVRYGAPLRQLGFSFEQSAAMVGKFEKEGVNTQLVMGSLRVALGKLAKEGKDPQTEFAKITQRIKDAGSAGEANKIALETFGARAGPDMAAAIREGRLSLGDLTKQIASGKDTIIGAGKDTQDFAEKWQLFKNKVLVGLEPLASRVFGAVGTAMDNIGPIADKVQTFVNKVVDAFHGTDEASGTLSKVLTSLKGVWKALGDIIGGVVTVASAAWERFGGILTDQALNILRTFAGVVSGVTKILQGVIDVITGVFTGDWSRAWEGVKLIFSGIWTAIGAIFTGAIGNLVNAFRLLLTALTAVGGELAGQFIQLGKNIVGSVVSGIQSVGSAIAGAAKWLFNTAKAGIEAYLSSYVAVGSWVLNRIAAGLTTVTQALGAAWGWLRNRVTEGIQALASGFVAVGSWILNRIAAGLTTITSALAAVGGWVRNRVSDALTAVADGFVSLGTWITNRLAGGLTTVTAALSGVGGWLKNRIGDALDGAKDGFLSLGGSIIGWIVEGLKGGANSIVNFLNQVIGVINKLPGVSIGALKGFAEGGQFKAQGLARGGAFARTGGLVSAPITLMGEEAPRHPEFVIPTNPAYRGRAQALALQAADAVGLASGGIFGKVGGLFGDAAGGLVDVVSDAFNEIKDLIGVALPAIPKMASWAGGLTKEVLRQFLPWAKDNLGVVPKMQAFGNRMAAKNMPYVYGGGHGGWGDGPFDCSGFVSAILHAAGKGWLGSPVSTDGLKVFGESGEGKQITVGVRGSTGRSAHTNIKVGDKYYESGGGGNGAHVMGGWNGSFPVKRHPPGYAEGGIFGLDPKSKIGRKLIEQLGWGLRQGGIIPPFVGTFHQGGVVPRNGLANVQAGERITPAHRELVAEIHATGPTLNDIVRVELREHDREQGAMYRAGVRA